MDRIRNFRTTCPLVVNTGIALLLLAVPLIAYYIGRHFGIRTHLYLLATGLSALAFGLAIFFSSALRRMHYKLQITSSLLATAEAKRQLLSSAMDAAMDQVLITDANGHTVYLNRAFEEETGYSLEETAGQNPLDLFGGFEPVEEIRKVINDSLATTGTWSGEIICPRKDGTISANYIVITPIKNKSGEIEHFIAIRRNVEEKKRFERQIDHLAHRDPLTGLPNRLLFCEQLMERLTTSGQTSRKLAVLFMDLDGFKLINDSMGHSAGDMLLKGVAGRLASALRASDIIARMGGDEFTVIVEYSNSIDDVKMVAHKLLDALTEPFVINGQELFISASMGISLYPSDGTEVETLVRNADAAMYRAKERGRNSCEYYTVSLSRKVNERVTLESALQKAAEREEFVLHYQPRVDLRTCEIKGAEALIRWQHSEMGLLLPGQFIPMAEETGIIETITRWVAQEAITNNKAWQDAGLPPIAVSVNIPAHQFQSPDLRHMTEKILERTGLDPQYLDLEITERGLMENPDVAAEVLCAFKRMGVHISVDDFGTGYSSLSYLKRFPVDTVKMDRSFVQDITIDPDAAAIAGAVIAMAHSLNLDVVAEGVETLEQWEFLRSLNCDEMQGYFISRPVPSEELAQLLRDQQDQISRRLAA